MKAFSLVVIAIVASLRTQSAETIMARDAKIDGVQLHYLTAGDGIAIILFHGYTQTLANVATDNSLGS